LTAKGQFCFLHQQISFSFKMDLRHRDPISTRMTLGKIKSRDILWLFTLLTQFDKILVWVVSSSTWYNLFVYSLICGILCLHTESFGTLHGSYCQLQYSRSVFTFILIITRQNIFLKLFWVILYAHAHHLSEEEFWKIHCMEILFIKSKYVNTKNDIFY